MKKWACLFLLLCGCHKPPKHHFPEHITVMMAGQSNMEKLHTFPYVGLAGFLQTLGETVPSIKVIPCSNSGSQIADWQKDGTLFNICLDVARKDHVDAILFYQGEADAARGMKTWPDQFTNMVASFRAIYGNIPVVYAQIGKDNSPKFATKANWKRIQDVQGNLHIENSAMVVTKDLEFEPFDIHLTPKSQREVGERFAKALVELL